MKRVITYGTFDLLHYGHVRLLERADAQALASDGVFYLKHGDTVVITGLPAGKEVTVVEDNGPYTTTWSDGTNTTTGNTYTATLNAETELSVTNELDDIPITGVRGSSVGFLWMLLCGSALLIIALEEARTKKRRRGGGGY